MICNFRIPNSKTYQSLSIPRFGALRGKGGASRCWFLDPLEKYLIKYLVYTLKQKSHIPSLHPPLPPSTLFPIFNHTIQNCYAA